MIRFTEPRKRLIDWVRKQLIGPPESAADSPELRGVFPYGAFSHAVRSTLHPNGAKASILPAKTSTR